MKVDDGGATDSESRRRPSPEGEIEDRGGRPRRVSAMNFVLGI